MKKSLVTVPSVVNEFEVTSVTDTPVVDIKIFVLLSTWAIDGVSDISFIGVIDGVTLGGTLEVSNVSLLGEEDGVVLKI